MTTDNIARPHIVAVTGGSGLLGRRLLPRLTQTAEVRLLTRGEPQHSAHGIPVHGDLRDPLALQRLVSGADAVIHLAGIAHTDLRSESQREQAHAVNVGGTRFLLQAAQKAGVKRFLYLSSAHVYAGQRGVGLSEQSPTASDGAYASMKLEAEAMTDEAAKAGMSVVVLRPCLVYGPGVRYNLQTLMRAIYRRRFVTALGANTERSMASVDTVADAILHLLQNPQCTGAYNIADQQPVVLERWVERLADLMGVERPLAVPRALLQALAGVGSAAAAIGLPAPLTRTSLSKLMTPFSLDVTRLAASGFVWPDNRDAVLREMIAHEFPSLTLGGLVHESF